MVKPKKKTVGRRAADEIKRIVERSFKGYLKGKQLKSQPKAKPKSKK